MEEKKKVLSYRELEWIKSSDFVERFADVMRLGPVSERGVYIEFGNLDYKKAGKGGELKDPFIKWHTRIILTREHLKAIAEVINKVIKENERIEKNDRRMPTG